MFRPTKGGDGGVAPRRRQDRPNKRIYLTGCRERRQTIPTRDRADRAHDERDARGLLVPGIRAHHAKPRRYPPSAMTSGGVSFDSAFDWLYEAQRRLAREGVRLGLGVKPDLATVRTDPRLRDLLERRTHVDQTPGERAMEREATLLLRSDGGKSRCA